VLRRPLFQASSAPQSELILFLSEWGVWLRTWAAFFRASVASSNIALTIETHRDSPALRKNLFTCSRIRFGPVPNSQISRKIWHPRWRISAPHPSIKRKKSVLKFTFCQFLTIKRNRKMAHSSHNWILFLESRFKFKYTSDQIKFYTLTIPSTWRIWI